jgi:exodeoxyribonuclease V gamma subunit
VVQYSFSDIADAPHKLKTLLSLYLNGQQQALLLNAALGEKAYKVTKAKAKAKPKAKPKPKDKAKPKADADTLSEPAAVIEQNVPESQLTQESFELFWQDPNNAFCLGNDPYMNFFWPTCPQLSDHDVLLESIYHDIYAKVSSETKTPVKAGSK